MAIYGKATEIEICHQIQGVLNHLRSCFSIQSNIRGDQTRDITLLVFLLPFGSYPNSIWFAFVAKTGN